MLQLHTNAVCPLPQASESMVPGWWLYRGMDFKFQDGFQISSPDARQIETLYRNSVQYCMYCISSSPPQLALGLPTLPSSLRNTLPSGARLRTDPTSPCPTTLALLGSAPSPQVRCGLMDI